MAQKVFFFDYEGDTRKVTCDEDEIECILDLASMVKTMYDDVEISTDDVKLWIKDQSFEIRHKLENPEDIYNGAVLEVTIGSNLKRKREEKKEHIASKRSRVEGPRFVVRVKGLPWKATQKQIREFFDGMNLVRVQILYKPDGRPSGDGLVEFQDEDDFEKGMLRDKENMGERYIEVIKTTGKEMDRALGVVDPNQIRNTKNKVIRMKGLPYSATEQDVLDFFQEGDIYPAKVHIISDLATGFPTGIAFAEFENQNQIVAALKLQRNEMGKRYIELNSAYMRDLKEALGLTSCGDGIPEGPVAEERGGYGNTCIRMRGLPFNTNDIDIVRFFKEVQVSPVRICCKSDGSEAVVELRSADISKAMTRHKSFIGHRYIELSPVSWDEVAATVGLSRPTTFRRFF